MNPQVGFFLNNALESLRRANLNAADLYLKQADKIQSNNPHTLRLWGVLLVLREDYSGAVDYFRRSLKKLPSLGVTHSNLGNALQKLKKYDESLLSYDQAIKLSPNDEEIWTNKGTALHELKRYEEALEHHDRSIQLAPNYAEAWSNKGNSLLALKRYEEALVHHDRSIQLKPLYLEAWVNKGTVFFELKRYKDAINCYEKVRALNPNFNWLYGGLLYSKILSCDWSGIESLLIEARNSIDAGAKTLMPLVNLSLFDSPELHQKAAHIFIQNRYPEDNLLGPIEKKINYSKIKVGYFSSDFRDHPVSHLMSELFELHDRNSFEIFAFSSSPNELSPIQLRLRKAFDQFLDVEDKTELEIAILSRNLGIDIAIDLGGHTKDAKTGIFSYRAAPIQVNYLGYPGTLGSSYYDYIIADEVVIPQSNVQYFCEKVAYLKNSFLTDDSKRLPAQLKFEREDFGLPKNGIVFCCFNAGYKVNRETLGSFAKILLAVKNSVLWMAEASPEFQNNFLAEALRLGVSEDRILFAKRIDAMPEHLARYRLADLFLDTSPYNAHTTALDALKAGLPIITMLGQSFPARVAASLLTTLDLGELITNNRTNFESLAIELTSNLEALAAIKQKLDKNLVSSPLFDALGFTRNLEDCYKKMYARYTSGFSPDHIFVD